MVSRNEIDDLKSRFAEVRRLGDGAEGGTWVANQPGGDRVVLKHVPPARKAGVARTFELLRASSSPHLPAVLELIDGFEESAWLVTRYVEGCALGAGPAPLQTVLSEVIGVATALAEIHALGSHHGDVSANNVIVTPTGGVVLTDFGQLGNFGCGTPGFIAPEALRGGGGPGADVFGVGSLLCLRLFGEVPWRRPEAVLAVEDAAGVRRHLLALAERHGIELSRALLGLLERVLDPDPHTRVADAQLLVARLRQLQRAIGAGDKPSAVTAWWLPTRWAYLGDRSALARSCEAIRSGDARLVAVSGPPGSGRGRMIEELVTALQLERAREHEAPLANFADEELLSRELGDGQTSGDWVEAWVEDTAAAASRVWGLREPPAWPPRLASSTQLRAAVLEAGANLGHDVLLIPVDPQLGARLRQSELAAGEIIVHELEPWGVEEIEACLTRVTEEGERNEELLRQWARALRETTGGWPAKVVRAIEALARSAATRPDRAAIEAALMHSEGTRLEPELARRVLDRRWGFEVSLPAALLAGEGVLASVVAAARRTLGEAVEPLAKATLEQRLREGHSPSAALALDARNPEAIEQAYGVGTKVELPSDLIAWLEQGGALLVGPRLRLRALRALIRRGEAERALALLEGIAATGPPSPAEALEGVRALEQLGRTQDALGAVDELLPRTRGADRARALGLRWRALVDAGQAPLAREEAEQWAATQEVEQLAGVGNSWRRAVAWLWGGLAQLYTGGEAHGWLERALAQCEGEQRGESALIVASLRARVFQLEANLAQFGGDPVRARERYRAASRAFEDAGEALGRVLVEGSLASLALDAGEFEEALSRGRRALRGFLARAQVQILPAAMFNLARALAAVGALDEGRRLHGLAQQIVRASGEGGGLSQARLRRAQLELELGGLSFEGSAELGSRRRALARGLGACAEQLAQAGATSEAADAQLQAACCWRVAGELGRARASLEAAHELLGEGAKQVELSVRLGLALERLAQARHTGALAEASAALGELPTPAKLWARGERLLAWTYDRTLLCVLHDHGSVGDEATGSVARRLLEDLEEIMNKAPPLDRRALRQSLLSEAGEAGPLRELVRELELAGGADAGEGQGAVATESATIEANERGVERGEAARTQQLLRLFRRLARHEQLDQLLDQVVEAMMELTDAERGVVCVGHGDARIEVAREFTAGAEGVTFSRSVIERVMEQGEPVLSVDAASDDRFDGSRSISHLNLRSVLAVPLSFRGELLGAAYVDHRLRRGNFDATDLAHMEDFADLAALAVAQARALGAVRSQAEELERQRAELATLLEQRTVDLVNLREEVRAGPERRNYRGMIGSSKPMQRVFRLVDRLADSDVPVVIYGESGTGKELVARAIHGAGGRAELPFVAENCGAIPESLLESVLFGHARGAFTGAQTARPGLFEAADRGTIFLDEIGETSAAMQTKLLRVLQEGEVRRLGETKARSVDVRVIAASNRDLAAMVERGEFRQDLYYRINVVKLELPPLRDRREDIPALIEHFLERHHRAGQDPLQISASALRKLTRYPWPGNVRELENEVQRWIALCEERVMPDDLSPAIEGSLADIDDPDDLELRPRVERLERELIGRAMERTGGNQTQAAQLLGLSRYGLQKKLKRFEETK